ncbi:F-box/kelch-repeat protein At3g23880-like [Solanum stenotomum]|uniref:F-box/kelch-repeat protein At3g23880-like n=1 Tax=Solanum stenotomum TaxID=172797 RepID=UPI0020D10B75|nr:F-box/kelch-repeat protein At3g23880-like [Solanum stenotomum]
METHMHIQEEIIMDILSRLPVKSLFLFKCVSKSWKALICEPSFKKMHLNHAKNDKLLIERTARDRNIFFYCSSLSSMSHLIVRDVQESVFVPQCVEGPYNYKIYGCCNGLFLIGIKQKYILWNPSTRESALLPSHWDKFFCDYNFGLGYDPTSDDYKVVKIPEINSEAPTEILSLKTGSCRKIYEGYFTIECHNMDYLTIVRGTFHWLVYSEGGRFSLFSFNISNEAFGELPLSKEMPLFCDTIEQGVTVLGGMLSVNFVCVKEDTIVFDLWVMKEYGKRESWTKLFTMRDSRDRFQVLPIVPKYIFGDGRVLLNSDRRDVLRTFKESDRRSNLIGPLTSDEDTMRWDGYTYTETLISPKDCVLAC